MGFKRQLWGFDQESVKETIQSIQLQYEHEKQMLLEELDSLANDNVCLEAELARLTSYTNPDSSFHTAISEQLWEEYVKQTREIFKKISECKQIEKEYAEIEKSDMSYRESLMTQLEHKLNGMETFLDSFKREAEREK
ncbi:hypothetical protein LSG31_13980 [Fodinisporobacter ferrooxydans]|uniref:DUF5082 domain-containing protein n=1 Tax=Fodinisporobacter ferrooxydans TaxID=2901836 RepID=A0ABY4CHW6_9BACL|nr:hypothetical protein LSG31_13980 [Alicyclobacillaceae bacterium MYW30-H2]